MHNEPLAATQEDMSIMCVKINILLRRVWFGIEIHLQKEMAWNHKYQCQMRIFHNNSNVYVFSGKKALPIVLKFIVQSVWHYAENLGKAIIDTSFSPLDAFSNNSKKESVNVW